MRAYIDSDILIWHLRGEEHSVRFLQKLQKKEEITLWIGCMQRAEVVFFMRSNEKEATLHFLSQFSTAPVNQEIIDNAAQLYRKWHHSHGIDINDTILAATVMQTGGKIYCLNKKHYPMPEIVVERAW